MNEITIRIESPELAQAIAQLAAAMHPFTNIDQKGSVLQQLQVSATSGPQPAAPTQAPIAPAPQVPVSQPSVAPQVPVVPVPASPQVPVSQPATTPAAAIPLAGAPTYSLEQIAKAGSALLDAGKMESLQALLTKYGIQAITQLQPEQYGAFATELRALGAQI